MRPGSPSTPLHNPRVRTAMLSTTLPLVLVDSRVYSTVEFYTVVMLLTFTLIVISIASPPHSFIPDLKPFFSASPSHRSLPFLLHE